MRARIADADLLGALSWSPDEMRLALIVERLPAGLLPSWLAP
jgi:hypothetical protein